MSRKDKFSSRDLVRITREARQKIQESEQTSTTLSEIELEDERDRFTEAVGSNCEFGDFKIYESNIEWSGLLPVENIAWSFSLDNNNGCYITANTLQLTDLSLERLNKLLGYYNVWLEYWMKEVRN